MGATSHGVDRDARIWESGSTGSRKCELGHSNPPFGANLMKGGKHSNEMTKGGENECIGHCNHVRGSLDSRVQPGEEHRYLPRAWASSPLSVKQVSAWSMKLMFDLELQRPRTEAELNEGSTDDWLGKGRNGAGGTGKSVRM